jgi:protein-tyrosine phosphatase
MAEIMLRQEFRRAGLNVVVTSTGVSDEEAGNGIDRRAAHTLQRHQFPAGENHRAQQVTFSDLSDADLVIPMTAYHARAIRKLAKAGGAYPEIRLMRAFDPKAPATADESDEYLLDVEDPWYGGEEQFETTYHQIESAIPGVIKHVAAQLAQEEPKAA